MHKRTYTGITALFFAVIGLLMAPTSADAVTPHRTTADPSVCETGFRGDPAYDRACLRKGVVGDAGALWYGIPKGVKGREADDAMNRRSVCAYAHRHGGITRMATELVTDMTYDAYTNHKQVDGWVVSMARVNCTRMGYRV